MNEHLNGHALQPKPVPCKVSWNNYPLPEPRKRIFSLPELPESVVKAGEAGEKVIEGIVKTVWFLVRLAFIPLALLIFAIALVGGGSIIHDLPTYSTGTLLGIIIVILLFKN